MSLQWVLTNLQGVPLAELRDRKGERRVDVGINAIRRAKVGISLEDPAITQVYPLSTRLKVFNDGHIIFNGTVQTPKFADDTCTINALDPGHQLERSYIQVPAPWGNYGFVRTNVDQGLILLALVQHPPSGDPAAWAPDAPQHGIVEGVIPVTIKRDRSYEPGKQIWAAMTELANVIAGPDFELEPLNRTDGVVCQLNVYESQGSDRSGEVSFEDGLGSDNARITYDPDGLGVTNRFTSLGQFEGGNAPPYYVSTQPESITSYGTWEGFEGRPDIGTAVTVEEHAQEAAAVGGFPVDFFDIVPRTEWDEGQYGTPPRFGPPGADWSDFWLGDIVKATVRRGHLNGSIMGRITEGSFVEADDAGNVQVELTASPTVSAAGVT
jgi:hypothetical protein